MKRGSTTRRKKKVYNKYNKGYHGFIKSTGGYTSLSIRRPSVLSDAISVTLDYCNAGTASVTTTKDMAYSANDLFSPEASGGHQPMGFDQLSAFYTRYRVLACSIDVQWSDINGVFGGIMLVPNVDPTGLTSISTAGETVRAKVGTLTTDATPTLRMRMYQTTCEMFGLTAVEVLDDVYSGLTTSSPSRIWYYHALFYSTNGSITGGYVTKLKYYCQFYARKSLASS